MEITVLGTASIGGVPEWDCTCPNCAAARMNHDLRRTRSSIAVTVDGDKHILFDAGHDVKVQLEQHELTPRPKAVGETFRESRLDSVFLTHGHADHTVGLAEFCTGKSFEIPVYAPPDLIDFLFGTDDEPNYFGDLGRLSKNYVLPVKLNEDKAVIRLGEVEVIGFEVPHTQVMESGRRYPSTTYAYEINHKDKRLIYAPDLGQLNEKVLSRLKGADVFLMDATFWWDDELNRVSGIPVTSYQLGHVPQEEAVELLKDVDVGRVVYTHFNHTNPVLNPSEPYGEKVKEMGQEIAHDGMKILLD
ncbi:MAG: MBL fold metallo-hydrolase [Candidatus Bathyarchaeota archaeon]|nr:MBL fold metallo-hydrolase [Candidatus Bathyarchaeota archaeon]